MTQVALVTGAAQGLGKAIAENLYKAGFAVVMTDANQDAVARSAAEIAPNGERMLALALDVLAKENFETALKQACENFGQVDALINNAAMTLTTPVMEITPEEFDRVTAVNQRGTFFGCQVFGQYFAGRGYGRIVNMASLAGQNGGAASGAHYGSSKGAILTMTKIFARNLAADGITVNAVAPGPMDLPSVRELVPADKLETIINEMIPVKELGSADFVADVVTKLASREASFVTGAAWDINGGIFMR
ncbi:SDR family NAD(P)-dependent oxidoreductase [Neptuniibacter halophilus]|uniref:SDR family NAD(P)-dependent oxidoreductase n=1 Tax=Neptuniibacter halophilus TaxID=651666 RepID=UPI002572254B|nr:SDR family NAD(P)-dependent oxidoreductase [Neptuniibacter halophilus]